MMIYNFEGCMFNFHAQVNCILSVKLRNNEDFNHISALKEQIIQNKISSNDFNFSGFHLPSINLKDCIIAEQLNFSKSTIFGNIILTNVELSDDVNLDFAKIVGEVVVSNSTIHKINMSRININQNIRINESKVIYFHADGDYSNIMPEGKWSLIVRKIKKYYLKALSKDFNAIKEEYGVKNGIYIADSQIGLISIDKLNIGKSGYHGIFMELVNISIYAHFADCNIEGDVWIRQVTVDWDLEFIGCRIKSGFSYELSKVNGKLNFDKVIFSFPYAQENASRESKRVWEKLGDKDKTDEYYFKEMEAKRQGKNIIFNYIELLLIQLPLGYGVILKRVIFAVLFLVLFFAFIFWFGKGIEGADSFLSNLYVSTLTALKLGASGYQPVNNLYQLLVVVEAVLGAFLWALLIVIFARKFIR